MCFCGGGSSKPEPVQQVVTSNSLPGWAEDFYKFSTAERKRLYEQSQQLAADNKDYQPYGGQRIQGFTEDQTAAMGGIRDLIDGRGVNALGEAMDMTRGAGAPVDMSIDPDRVTTQTGAAGIEGWENPYREQVVQRSLDAMDRRHAMDEQKDAAAATTAGAYGGSRHAVLDSLRDADHMRARGDMAAQMYDQGFQYAGQQMQADRGRTMQADTFNSQMGLSAFNANRDQANTNAQRGLAGAQLIGSLGETDFTTQGRGLQALMGAGAMQQDFGQANLDLAYGDFQAQQQHPFVMQGFQSAALEGIPFNAPGYASSTTTSPAPQQPNAFSQVAGLGVAGLGTAAALGWQPFG